VVGTGFLPYSTQRSSPTHPVVLATVVTDGSGNFSKPVTVRQISRRARTTSCGGVDPAGATRQMRCHSRFASGYPSQPPASTSRNGRPCGNPPDRRRHRNRTQPPTRDRRAFAGTTDAAALRSDESDRTHRPTRRFFLCRKGLDSRWAVHRSWSAVFYGKSFRHCKGVRRFGVEGGGGSTTGVTSRSGKPTSRSIRQPLGVAPARFEPATATLRLHGRVVPQADSNLWL